jgi:hypothetical protein
MNGFILLFNFNPSLVLKSIFLYALSLKDIPKFIRELLFLEGFSKIYFNSLSP